ncbi:MAG: hypothetical protein ACREEE_12400 [Dongiaceae bacterium]
MSNKLGKWRLVALCPSLLWLAACASVMSGSTQSMNVITEPSGAQCTLTRDGKSIAFVNPTPGSLTIDKSAKDITVRCQLDKYEETTATVSSSHDAWSSAGNILAWGIFFPVGLAVDAGTGAMNEYPPTVIVRLIQRSFDTAEARDKFYDGAKRTVESAAATRIEETKKNCKKQDGCAADIKELEDARDGELATLEQKRLNALVEGEPTVVATARPDTVETTPTDTSVHSTERQLIEQKWQARLATIRQIYCQNSGAAAPDCERSTKAAEAQRDAELAVFDQQHATEATN